MKNGTLVLCRQLLTVIGVISGGVITAQFNPINDSTSARYRCEVEEYTVATVLNLDSIQQIDFSERDLLKPMYRRFKMTRGVNAQHEPYFQIETFEATTLEDWMSISNYNLLTPKGSYGLSATGEVEYHFTNNAVENQDIADVTSANMSDGFQPLLMFFPTLRSEYVSEAVQDGATLTELSGGIFKLSWANKEVTIDPDLKEITRELIHSDRLEKIVEGYSLFAPYGYVVSYRYSESTRTDIPHPVTFKTVQGFSNHVIEDQGNMIPKYTEKALIEIYPVPVQGEYEVVFKGVPDAQVSQVLIHDFMGNLVATHVSPQVSRDVMVLDASTYPSGVLIAVVYTQQGVYTQTFTKS